MFVRSERDLERAAKLRFPLIVKHPNGYASIDLSRASRVTTAAGLRRQANKILKRRGAALIEEFIEGLEATVLVAENPRAAERPIAYPPIQYEFPKGESFKHEEMKWVEYDRMREFPVEDRRLAARLKREAAAVFVALDGAGFGRCDFRVADDGTPHLLEINANCGVYYPLEDAGGADLCLLHGRGGHELFTRRLIAAARRRLRVRRRTETGRGQA